MGVIIKLIMRGLKIIENSNQRKLKREKKRYNYHFTGQVQSVGFRYTARNAALLSGVTGWVYNSSDGAVIMEVQGTIEQIEKQLEIIEELSYHTTKLYNIINYDLRENGFIIADLSSMYIELEKKWVRVSIGKSNEMKKLAKLINNFLEVNYDKQNCT